MKLNLKWGGTFENRHGVKGVELEPFDSSLALKLEHLSDRNDAFTHEALSRCTKMIDGKAVTYDQAAAFWDTVAVPDGEYALLELIKCVWKSRAKKMRMAVICAEKHVTQIEVDLTAIEVRNDATRDFKLDLVDGFKSHGDHLVKRIHGEVYTFAQSRAVEEIDSDMERTYAIIAACCHDADEPGRPFNKATVQRMTPGDRRDLQEQMETGHVIIDLMIRDQCGKHSCEFPAIGRVNFKAFF